MRRPYECALACVAVAVLSAAACAQDAWTHRGRDSARNGVAPGGTPAEIAAPRFVTTDERYLVGQSMPAVADGRVFVYAESLDGLGNELLAFSETDGGFLWACPLDPAAQDSRSSPTVDLARGTVLIASGSTVTAVEMATGDVAWETPLGTSVVNSTACVHGAYAYIVGTTASPQPGAPPSSLYCLNLDPAPGDYEPGEVVWSAPLAASSGCEASIDASGAGHVIVADSGGYVRQFTLDGEPGWVFAVPGAGSTWPPPTYGGFYGGATIDGGFAYAATYNFNGPEDNSRLYCINVATGVKVWEAPCERTDALPLVAGDLVILSGGMDGYGSAAKIEAFDKATGAKLWQWTDAGSWTHQPIVVGDVLYVGTPAADSYAPCTWLHGLDLTRTPQDPGFVIDEFEGAGSSPAYANGNVYTIGADGLHAFGPPVGQGPALEIAASIADGEGWVYQNTAGTTQDRHASRLTITFASEAEPGEGYDISIADDGPGTNFTLGAAVIDNRPGEKTLTVEVVGGRVGSSTPGSAGAAYAVTITLTGRASGRSDSAGASLVLRTIGDVDGDGSRTGADKQYFNQRLNNVATPYLDRCYDLDGSGGAPSGLDKQVMNQALNNVPLP